MAEGQKMCRCARSCFVSVSLYGGELAGPRGATGVRERTMADQRRLHPFSRPLNPRAVRLLVCALDFDLSCNILFFILYRRTTRVRFFLFAGYPSISKVTRQRETTKLPFKDLS